MHINGPCKENRPRSQQTPITFKIIINSCKLIYLMTRIEFTLTILKSDSKIGWEILSSIFTCFIFDNMLAESRGFTTIPVNSRIKPTCFNYPYLIREGETKLLDFVTVRGMKPWRSVNSLPNTKTCRNERWNFSDNFRMVVLKLLVLTRFLSPNISIYISLF